VAEERQDGAGTAGGAGHEVHGQQFDKVYFRGAGGDPSWDMGRYYPGGGAGGGGGWGGGGALGGACAAGPMAGFESASFNGLPSSETRSAEGGAPKNGPIFVAKTRSKRLRAPTRGAPRTRWSSPDEGAAAGPG